MTFSASGTVERIRRLPDGRRVAEVQFPNMGGALQGDAILQAPIHPGAQVNRGDTVTISGSIAHSASHEQNNDEPESETPSEIDEALGAEFDDDYDDEDNED